MLHPHRLRVAFEDLKAAIVAAAAHAFAAAEGLCGAQERPTDWSKTCLYVASLESSRFSAESQ